MNSTKHPNKPSRKVSRNPKRSQTPKDQNAGRDKSIDDQSTCIKAPEWAEHHRLWDDDQPCDDGRSGKT